MVERFPKSKFNDKVLEDKLATIIGYFNNVIKQRLVEAGQIYTPKARRPDLAVGVTD